MSIAQTDAPTILVIDDNPGNLRVLLRYLDDAGFETLAAEDSESAFELLDYILPNLILLDVMMPEIDGFETCQQLKADERTKDIPVIFMTALNDTPSKVRGFEVGAVDYVTKPVQYEELLARVNTHLRILDLNRKLTKANADKDKFFSIVAHDLKAPFMPLLGMSQLLVEMVDMTSTSHIKEMAESLNRSAHKVYNLLDNLLQWSRIQMGRMPYQPTALNLFQLTDKVVELLQEVAVTKNIAIRNTIIETVYIQADRNMLAMIIRNLVSNALKFTPTAGQITISANPADIQEGFIKIAVTDTGIGISDEDKAKLFRLDVQHSTLGTAEETGTGLGLIMCQEMVKLHEGTIGIETVLGQGSTFWFTMPITSASMITTPVKPPTEITNPTHHYPSAQRTKSHRVDIIKMNESINRSAKAIYDLLDKLLQEAEQELEQLTFNPKRIQLKPCLERSLARLRPEVEKKQPQFILDIDTNLFVWADRKIMCIILQGLISNAIKFTPAGGIITINAHLVTNSPDPTMVELSITDSGAGIAPKPASELLLMNNSELTIIDAGLGLLMYRKLIERHGGRIWIESELGQGTTVTFAIPTNNNNLVT